jgi:hypothetical protein
MTVTIQLNSAEDFKLLEPLLRLIRESGVKVHVSSEMKPENGKLKSPGGLVDKLHGIVSLPADFDYKSFMADELLKKHTANG